MDIYNTPLLTAREVARHLQMPETTLDRWIRTQAADAPLVHAVTPTKRNWPRMPFVAVVEAYVLRSLRDLGFHLNEIQQAAELVRSEFGDEYALASRRIASDGVSLFVEFADQSLVQVGTRQVALREVLDEYLRYISWDERGIPRSLKLSQYGGVDVVIDPRSGWGAPALGDSKVPVGGLLDLWKAGEPISVVAEEYDLNPDTVEDVLRAAAA